MLEFQKHSHKTCLFGLTMQLEIETPSFYCKQEPKQLIFIPDHLYSWSLVLSLINNLHYLVVHWYCWLDVQHITGAFENLFLPKQCSKILFLI